MQGEGYSSLKVARTTSLATPALNAFSATLKKKERSRDAKPKGVTLGKQPTKTWDKDYGSAKKQASVQFELPSALSSGNFERMGAGASPLGKYWPKMMPASTEEEVQREKAERKVAPYVAHTSGKPARRDRSLVLLSKPNPNETLKKTAATHAASCTCSEALCRKIANRDETNADKAKSPEAPRHEEDLVDRFNNADAQVEQAQNVALSVFLGGLGTQGLLGGDVTGAAPPATNVATKPDQSSACEGSAKMTGVLSGRLEGIVELVSDERSQLNPIVQIDELVSLDGTDEDPSGKKNNGKSPGDPDPMHKDLELSMRKRASITLRYDNFQVRGSGNEQKDYLMVQSPKKSSVKGSQEGPLRALATMPRGRPAPSSGSSARGRGSRNGSKESAKSQGQQRDGNVKGPGSRNISRLTSNGQSSERHALGVNAHAKALAKFHHRPKDVKFKKLFYQRDDPVSDIDRMTFRQLMDYLAPPNDKIHGCELLVTDTVFLDNKAGKVAEIIRTDKEGFLQKVTQPAKLKFQSIRRDFTSRMRERRKQAPSYQHQQYLQEADLAYAQSKSLGRTTTLRSERTLGLASLLGDAGPVQSLTSLDRDLLNREVAAGAGTSKSQGTAEADEDEYMDVLQTQQTSISRATAGGDRAPRDPAKKKVATGLLDAAIFRFETDPQHVPAIATRTSRASRKEDESASNYFSPEETKQSDQSTQAHGRDYQSKAEEQVGPIVRVVNEAQFISMMDEKATSRQWRALECIQTCVKAARGLGTHIPVHFVMQVDYADSKKLHTAVRTRDSKALKGQRLALRYDYGAIGSDYRDAVLAEHADDLKQITPAEVGQQVEARLKAVRPRDYCLRQILKMCYYVQKLHSIEILQMDCDFFQDANGHIWLFYVSDILQRPQMKSEFEIAEEKGIKQQNLDALLQKRQKVKMEAEARRAAKRQARQERHASQEAAKQAEKLARKGKLRPKSTATFASMKAPGKEEARVYEVNVQAGRRQVDKYGKAFEAYFLQLRQDLQIDETLQDSDGEDDETGKALQQMNQGKVDGPTQLKNLLSKASAGDLTRTEMNRDESDQKEVEFKQAFQRHTKNVQERYHHVTQAQQARGLKHTGPHPSGKSWIDSDLNVTSVKGFPGEQVAGKTTAQFETKKGDSDESGRTRIESVYEAWRPQPQQPASMHQRPNTTGDHGQGAIYYGERFSSDSTLAMNRTINEAKAGSKTLYENLESLAKMLVDIDQLSKSQELEDLQAGTSSQDQLIPKAEDVSAGAVKEGQGEDDPGKKAEAAQPPWVKPEDNIGNQAKLAWQTLQEEKKQQSLLLQAQLARKFITEKLLSQRNDKAISGATARTGHRFVDFDPERARASTAELVARPRPQRQQARARKDDRIEMVTDPNSGFVSSFYGNLPRQNDTTLSLERSFNNQQFRTVREAGTGGAYFPSGGPGAHMMPRFSGRQQTNLRKHLSGTSQGNILYQGRQSSGRPKQSTRSVPGYRPSSRQQMNMLLQQNLQSSKQKPLMTSNTNQSYLNQVIAEMPITQQKAGNSFAGTAHSNSMASRLSKGGSRVTTQRNNDLSTSAGIASLSKLKGANDFSTLNATPGMESSDQEVRDRVRDGVNQLKAQRREIYMGEVSMAGKFTDRARQAGDYARLHDSRRKTAQSATSISTQHYDRQISAFSTNPPEQAYDLGEKQSSAKEKNAGRSINYQEEHSVTSMNLRMNFSRAQSHREKLSEKQQKQNSGEMRITANKLQVQLFNDPPVPTNFQKIKADLITKKSARQQIATLNKIQSGGGQSRQR